MRRAKPVKLVKQAQLVPQEKLVRRAKPVKLVKQVQLVKLAKQVQLVSEVQAEHLFHLTSVSHNLMVMVLKVQPINGRL